MPLKLVPFLLIALAVVVIGYGTWLRAAYPPRVIATSSHRFVDTSGTELIFAKRQVAVAGFEVTEVQLPGGTWIDCRSDCTAAIKAEYTEVWDQRMLGRR